MTRPLWTLDEVLAATGGEIDLPPQKTGGPEGVPPAGYGAGPIRAPGAAITGISIDTRSIEPGDLFVPLTDTRDGHAFVTPAFQRGATAALVRHNYLRQPGDGSLIRVDDPLRALERLGIAARARLTDAARVIAVTGSAGKTGTKEMLRACLRVCASQPDRVHAPEKSFNNHWGVPLTLARMPADAEFAVFEIGMNHADEIRPLTKMVRPHIAIVTNVLPVHVGNFPDGEIGVANAKAEIFEGLEAQPLSPYSSGESWGDGAADARPGNPPESPGEAPDRQARRADPGLSHAAIVSATGEDPGSPRPLARSPRPGTREGTVASPKATAIILRDSPHYACLRAAAEARGAAVVTFGRDPASDAALVGSSERPGIAAEPITTVAAHLADAGEGFTVEYELGMPGVHIAINSLAVVLALQSLLSLKPSALRALASLRPASGRGARQTLAGASGAILLLDESYNANPASMAAALVNLDNLDPAGRSIAVLGDMLELGADAVRYHVGLANAAGAADLVFCCGPHMRHLFDILPSEKQGLWAPNSSDLIPHVLATIRAGDAVMVKGSLGSRMAPIVDAIKKRFADG